MKERQLFLFLTFLPVALAIFFWDLDTRLTAPSTSSTDAPQTPVDERQLPTTILEKTRLTQYDISGLQSQKVTSDRLLSNDFQKHINIDSPTITLETDQGLWLAKSDTGRFDQMENKLSLLGSVTLTKTPASAQEDITERGQSEAENQSRTATLNQPRTAALGLDRLQSPVQMQTEQLDYYPQIRLAKTATPVTITTQGHYIESEGIRVDLANSVYTLPKRVRSTHEPM